MKSSPSPVDVIPGAANHWRCMPGPMFSRVPLMVQMKHKLQAAQNSQAPGAAGGGDLRRSLSEPLVLIEVDPSHFQNSSGGLSHLVADVFLYHEMCSCRVVRTGERQVANHACGPWRKCFDALQPLGDDIWLYERLIVYFGPVSGSCDIFQCTKLLHEFNGWKESHTSRRKTQLLHTAPD